MVGKQLDIFFQTHFTQLEALNNKSKCSSFKCNYCGDQPDSWGQSIEHCENQLANHIVSTTECPNAPPAVHSAAHLLMKGKKPEASESSESVDTSSASQHPLPAKKHKIQSNLDSLVDCPMTEVQQNVTNRKLFKLIIHANLPFSVVDNIFLHDFTDELQPSFNVASCFTMTQTFLDSENSCVHLEMVDELASMQCTATILVDGWEDIMHHSVYGVAAAHVGKPSIILGLHNLTGHRGKAQKILNVTESCMANMGIVDASCALATVTDNSNVMKRFQTDFEKLHPWVIVSLDLSLFPPLSQYNCCGSHFWGGILKEAAKITGVLHSFKLNCGSQWYAVILLALSVEAH
ncbi:hypothetical protein GYMLUDRAFT_65460 [Collybiopsis luxurians FD-317 M1]|uniref:DUF659 domain-containing protein n=1 Tax=Collybiopsis luxurians FD-317 M1 TaxID=944289 RepID=A0A0D0BWV6_9AGAR|nr:hypothetical protein GYMLUDRAFT_65460 [Collybiopsis luxurians FD-317 M1]